MVDRVAVNSMLWHMQEQINKLLLRVEELEKKVDELEYKAWEIKHESL